MSETSLNKITIPKNYIRFTIINVMLLLTLMIKSNLILIILIALSIYLLTENRPYWIYVISKTIYRDIRYVIKMALIAYKFKRFVNNDITIVKSFHKFVKKHPDKIMIHTEYRSWSFREIFELSNQSSHFFKKIGTERGDTVGILLENGKGAISPILWLGLNSIGAIASLIPPQLKGKALIHAIKTSNIKTLIFSQHFVNVLEEIYDELDIKKIQLYQWNVDNDMTPLFKYADDFGTLIKSMPKSDLKDEIEKGKSTDTALYIFTSGTTGLPKPAIIKHYRFIIAALGLQRLLKINNDDIYYVPLPMHHTSGGIMGYGVCLLLGNTIVHRSKFSVSNFWKDCIKYNCTIAQYIGEMCRFLLNSVDTKCEDMYKSHKIRIMIGNGLRKNIWETFKKTFNIKEIIEVYGSTEGNSAIVNIDGTVGSIGSLPPYFDCISPIQLIKCDNTTGEPIRNNKGFCITCKPGEPGLYIAKINKNNIIQKFEGYLDKEATNKKIINNVYRKGDSYFNSGDILLKDHFGYIYFVDRSGDTFRWRGENVSTTEVENIISSILKLNDVSVYGVQVPNIEGKAGMAAIADPERKIDLNKLKEVLNKNLPTFAHPIFIRITPNIDVTTTFKLVKKNYQTDGFDVTKINDPIYFLDPVISNYIPLTPSLYKNIIYGLTKL